MPLIDTQHVNEIESDLVKAPPREGLGWSSVADTHVGYVRSQNEDDFYYSQEQGLWVVADGMGGHSRGDRASKAVVDDIRSFVRMDSITESIRDLEARFLLANTACRNMYSKDVVGSTVAAMLSFGPLCIFLWAGDSRIYRLRNGTLEKMTEDHNLVQEKIRRGEVTHEEADKHPSANILTRAIGVHQNLHIEMEHALVTPGDRYLLCSDGLYRDLQLGEIEKLLDQNTPDDALSGLIETALKRGGGDNITAIIVDAE